MRPIIGAAAGRWKVDPSGRAAGFSASLAEQLDNRSVWLVLGFGRFIGVN